MSRTATAHHAVSSDHAVDSDHAVVVQQVAGRTVPGWLLTVWAALAALAVCIVAVFYTPIVPPTAWRSTDAVVVSLGRHAQPDDGLSL